jgi:MFS family permease
MSASQRDDMDTQRTVKKMGVSRNVVLAGFTSFFTDVSSEMIYPLIQAFVSMIMSSQKALLGPILGIIEGVADATASLLKVFFGSFSDRIGRKKVLMAGYGLYAAVYIAFGCISPKTNFLLWFFWPVYGVYYAMTDGVEKAFVSGIAPKGSRATALGFYNTIVGAGLLPASIIAGILFSVLPSAPFLFGGATALVTVAVIGFFVGEG